MRRPWEVKRTWWRCKWKGPQHQGDLNKHCLFPRGGGETDGLKHQPRRADLILRNEAQRVPSRNVA